MTTKTFDLAGLKMADNAHGSFTAILSTPSLDRDGEIVDPGAFEPLPDRIPIDVDHDRRALKTVGSGRPYYDGDMLMIEGTFAATDDGQKTRALVAGGHLRTMSVEFMNALFADDAEGVPHLYKGELIKAGFVSVPAQPDARVMAAKAAVETGLLSEADAATAMAESMASAKPGQITPDMARILERDDLAKGGIVDPGSSPLVGETGCDGTLVYAVEHSDPDEHGHVEATITLSVDGLSLAKVHDMAVELSNIVGKATSNAEAPDALTPEQAATDQAANQAQAVVARQRSALAMRARVALAPTAKGTPHDHDSAGPHGPRAARGGHQRI